jgi:uncharacterized integral membrane protein
MSKLFIYLLASILLVAFAFSNSEHVALSFIFGAPVHIRLIFLLLVTFLIGASVPVFYFLLSDARRRRRGRMVASTQPAEIPQEP